MRSNGKFSPLVKILKMDNRHFGYDAASGLLCEIEDEDAGFLSGENSPVISPVMKKAQARGVFLFKEMERCTVALDAIPEIVTHHIEHIFPRKLILEVTENCNLRCKYCFNTIGNGQRIHAKKQMTAETAFAGIDHYFKVYREKFLRFSASEQEYYLKRAVPNLSWWGGEPFLNFELIKASKSYFENLPWEDLGIDKNLLRYAVVTNLTVLNSEILEFLVENQINMFVSLDGAQQLHDANRVFANGEGSFEIVKNHLDQLYAAAPEYCRQHIGIHAVYENRKILLKAKKFFKEYLYDSQGNRKFCEIFYIYQSKPNDEINFSTKKRNKKYSIEVFKQKMEILSALSKEELDDRIRQKKINITEYLDLFKLEKKLLFDASQGCNHYDKLFACPAGAEIIYVGTNGDLHACHKTDESYPIGNVKEHGVDLNKLVRFNSDYLSNFQNDCRKCWAFRFCGKCPAQMLNKGVFLSASKAECACMRRYFEIEMLKYIVFVSNERLYNYLKEYDTQLETGIIYV